MSESPAERSQRILRESRAQDVIDEAMAQKALARFAVLGGAPDGFPDIEEKAYLIAYKDALRDSRGRIRKIQPDQHNGSMLPHASASDCTRCHIQRALDAITNEED